jgi:hypothetical protein
MATFFVTFCQNDECFIIMYYFIFKGGPNMQYGYNNFLNPYTMIIVILIVLQWFRVGCYGTGIPAAPGVAGIQQVFTPEPGLLNNGGLFIITIFLLSYCGCNNR